MLTRKLRRFLWMLTGSALLLGWLIGMVTMWVILRG
jgi:hypothetical protein